VAVEEVYAADEVADSNSTDSRGIPGWEKVDELSHALLCSKGISLSDKDAHQLFEKLDEFYKKPLRFNQVARKPATGKFSARK
jgi:hypothetical protein